MKEMTLDDHAEAWAKENGQTPPKRETPEWNVFYTKWVEHAFAEFRTPQ